MLRTQQSKDQRDWGYGMSTRSEALAGEHRLCFDAAGGPVGPERGEGCQVRETPGDQLRRALNAAITKC